MLMGPRARMVGRNVGNADGLLVRSVLLCNLTPEPHFVGHKSLL